MVFKSHVMLRSSLSDQTKACERRCVLFRVGEGDVGKKKAPPKPGKAGSAEVQRVAPKLSHQPVAVKHVLSLVPPLQVVEPLRDHTPSVTVQQPLTLSGARGWCRVAFSLVGAEVTLPDRQDRPKDAEKSARAKASWAKRKAAIRAFDAAQMDLFALEPIQSGSHDPQRIVRKKNLDGPLKLLMVLRGFCRREDPTAWSHASLETMAEWTGRCVRTVGEYLRTLESVGLLERLVTCTDSAGRTRHGGGQRRYGSGYANQFRLTELAWEGFPTGLSPEQREEASRAARAKHQTADGRGANRQTLLTTSLFRKIKTQPPLPPFEASPRQTGKVVYMQAKTNAVPSSETPGSRTWTDDEIRADLQQRGYTDDVVAYALEELRKSPGVVSRRNWAEVVARRRVNEIERDSRARVTANVAKQTIERSGATATNHGGYGGAAGEAYEREALEKKRAGAKLDPWERVAALPLDERPGAKHGRR